MFFQRSWKNIRLEMFLAELTSLVGITREIAEANNDHSGGAQYFLKEYRC